VIIPFFYHGRIVGNTARRVTDGKPKYLSDQHHHFVFNVDAQKEEQRYLFVCEGPFDALAVDGVALLTNDIAEQQARIINSLGHEVIVIPDQDEAGLNLIDRAMANDWSVAFPNWDHDVKDCADAVQKYGKLFVTVDAIKTAQRGEIKLKMAKKKLEQRIKIHEENN
jgi:DNA primase